MGYMDIEKVETVKEIIVNLARDIEQTRASEKTERAWSTIPVEQFLRKDGTIKSVRGLRKMVWTKFDYHL